MGRTSIPCDQETRQLLKRDKEQRGMEWDEYLRTLAGERPDNLAEKVRQLEGRMDDMESKLSRY